MKPRKRKNIQTKYLTPVLWASRYVIVTDPRCSVAVGCGVAASDGVTAVAWSSTVACCCESTGGDANANWVWLPWWHMPVCFWRNLPCCVETGTAHADGGGRCWASGNAGVGGGTLGGTPSFKFCVAKLPGWGCCWIPERWVKSGPFALPLHTGESLSWPSWTGYKPGDFAAASSLVGSTALGHDVQGSPALGHAGQDTSQGPASVLLLPAGQDWSEEI